MVLFNKERLERKRGREKGKVLQNEVENIKKGKKIHKKIGKKKD